MRKVTATSAEDLVGEDRPTIYISSGRGNTAGLPEIHIEITDPATGQEVRGWFFKDELLAAILDPDPTPLALRVEGAA